MNCIEMESEVTRVTSDNILTIHKIRHGRVARQRVPATQNLSNRDEAHPGGNRISRAP